MTDVEELKASEADALERVLGAIAAGWGVRDALMRYVAVVEVWAEAEAARVLKERREVDAWAHGERGGV